MRVLLVICLSILPFQSFAERKPSILGDIIDSTKSAVNTVKQDVKNYNTRVIKLKVVNKTGGSRDFEILEPYNHKNPPKTAPKTVFSGNVGPRQTKTFNVEIVHSPIVGKWYNVEGGVKATQFDITTQDHVTHTIN